MYGVRLLGVLIVVFSGSAASAQLAREGSGTAWLPDASPMYAVHVQRGAWMLMAHENLFLQFLDDAGKRGDDQLGSINWVMGMAQHSVGRGRLGLRGMFSLEPWTIRGCGYPDLLASGEQCRGETIHDRQHPHDVAMELSAEYDAPIRGATRWQVYAAPSGEPALGPVAYPHRVSAMPNPLAPIAHHWLDSTHVSFGVVTGALYGERWKVETSAFNGREPDEHRKDFDFGALDSVSGRIWFLPTSKVALQMSGGHLSEAEAGDAGAAFALGASAPRAPRRDVNRVTASATFHQMIGERVSASTFAWGRNSESGEATNALLIETNITFKDRDAWFGRLEVVQKTPHDLDVPPAKDTFTVSKIQGGYTRYISAMAGFKAGVGAAVSAGIVPGDLKAAYGGRVNPGVAIFLTLRPAAMAMGTAAGGGVRTMVMVQTAYAPAKLMCPAGFDPRAAARTVYEGQTYYFCSTADRDRFLIDPKMSLSMMPPKQ
jgi:YHS domain-containing protein